MHEPEQRKPWVCSKCGQTNAEWVIDCGRCEKTNEPEVKPCPFCGHRGVTVQEGSTFRWRYAFCDGCGAQGGEVRCQTLGEGTPEEWEKTAEAAATAEWNERTAESSGNSGELEALRAERDALKAQVEALKDEAGTCLAALKRCASAAGNPDPARGCRLVIYYVTEVTENFPHGLADHDQAAADLALCPNCGGPADNGHDRCVPPSPYFCVKCMVGYYPAKEDAK